MKERWRYRAPLIVFWLVAAVVVAGLFVLAYFDR